MPGDTRRIIGPEGTLPPIFVDTTSQESFSKDKRVDGRSFTELRKSLLRFNVSTEAAGSAYYECGRTKIICSVYGPKDVIRKSEFSHKGQLYCEFKYAPYSSNIRQPYIPSAEEKTISVQLQQALESVVLLDKFPKARVEIFIHVLENDGGAIGCALTCAGAALCNAGIQMYDLVLGCSLVQDKTLTILDPTAKEEEAFKNENECSNQGIVVLGMMPNYNQVILLQQPGNLDISIFAQCMKELMISCQKLSGVVRHFLQKNFEDNQKEPPPLENGS